MKPGDCFYMKNDRRKYHIVTILDAEPTPQIVYKFYGIHKQRWHYKIEPVHIFEYCIKSGFYKKKYLKKV